VATPNASPSDNNLAGMLHTTFFADEISRDDADDTYDVPLLRNVEAFGTKSGHNF
jgi:hypothetical protein